MTPSSALGNPLFTCATRGENRVLAAKIAGS
jgi:hypothetical protein